MERIKRNMPSVNNLQSLLRSPVFVCWDVWTVIAQAVRMCSTDLKRDKKFKECWSDWWWVSSSEMTLRWEINSRGIFDILSVLTHVWNVLSCQNLKKVWLFPMATATHTEPRSACHLILHLYARWWGAIHLWQTTRSNWAIGSVSEERPPGPQ